MDSYREMLKEFSKHNIKNVPYDWTIYYLRKKALSQKISKEELAWVILNFNKKRGYYQFRDDNADENKENKIEKYYALKVTNVKKEDAQNYVRRQTKVY